MRRRLLGLVAGGVAGALVIAASAPAHSDAAASGSARAVAVDATAGGGLKLGTPAVTLLGAFTVPGNLGSLLTGTLNPLLGALPGKLLGAITTGLANGGLSADDIPKSRQPRPSSGYPNCKGGWTKSVGGSVGNCFSVSSLNINTAGLISLTTGLLQGYATGDDTGYIASAQVANVGLSVLGSSVLSLTTATSTSSCPGTGNCDPPKSSLTGLSGSSPASVTVPLGTLLSTLGTSLNALSSVLGLVELDDSGSTVTLTATVGPGGTGGGTSAVSAWGGEIKLDLSVNLSLTAWLNVSVLGIGLLKTKVATISASTTGVSPNLLDIKLAETSATIGDLPPDWVPSGLI